MGKILSLTGPSGSGKSTITAELLRQTKLLKFVTSTTTRAPRAGDLPGEYEYVSREQFLAWNTGRALQWMVEVSGQYYGTRKDTLSRFFEAVPGENGLTEVGVIIITPHTIEQIKRAGPGKVYSIYIVPPPPRVLRARMKERGDPGEKIAQRIAEERGWRKYAHASGLIDEFVPNTGPLHFAVSRIFQRVIRLSQPELQ